MGIVERIKLDILQSLKELYEIEFTNSDLTINLTKPEFEGDYTLVLFSFLKQLKKSPEQLGKEIGTALLEHQPDLFSGFNVISGFLNITISDQYWLTFLAKNY